MCEYVCEKCNYHTNRRNNYERHLLSKRHKTNTVYECTKCNFKTTYHSHYIRHMKSAKHQENTEDKDVNKPKFIMEDNMYICGKCGKEFATKRGYTIHSEICNTDKHKQGNIVINNTFQSINILNYLNSECSDAQSLTDFVKTLQVSLEQLEQVGAHGYLEGIKNIFVDKLTEMKLKERPLHCTDTKRLTFYMKHDDIWEKTTNCNFLDGPMDAIYNKQFECLQEWKEQNPDYLTNPRKCDKFTDIMVGITEVDQDGNKERYKTKLAKVIGTNVKLKKND